MIYTADTCAAEVSNRGLGNSQRFVPVGFFVGWLIENDGVRPVIDEHARRAFLSREKTGPQVFASIGGELGSENVSVSFIEFTKSYVHKHPGGLFDDMAEWFPVPSVFDVRDTWHNYEWMRIRFVDRYSEWRATTAAAVG